MASQDPKVPTSLILDLDPTTLRRPYRGIGRYRIAALYVSVSGNRWPFLGWPWVLLGPETGADV